MTLAIALAIVLVGSTLILMYQWWTGMLADPVRAVPPTSSDAKNCANAVPPSPPLPDRKDHTMSEPCVHLHYHGACLRCGRALPIRCECCWDDCDCGCILTCPVHRNLAVTGLVLLVGVG